MRKQLWQSDGRLKTGRISLIFFLCLVLGLGLLFKLQKPVDKAIVVVRHIFTAPVKPKLRAPRQKAEVRAVSKPEKAAKPKEKESEPVAKPHPVPVMRARAEAAKESAAVSESVKKFAVVPEKPLLQQVREDAVAKQADVAEKVKKQPVPKPHPVSSPEKKAVKKKVAAAINEPVKEGESAPPGLKSQDEKRAVQSAVVLVQQNSAAAAELMTEEVVVVKSVIQPETSSAPAAVTLLTESQRQLLSSRSPAPEAGKVSASPVKFAVVPKFKLEKSLSAKPAAAKKSDFKAVSVTPAAGSAMAAAENGRAPGITVAGKEYKKLHHAWQTAGRSKKGDDHVIPLQIENLRAAYDLLQMKAVVIRPDESCIDLSDGSRIPVASLDRFSTTVLQIDDPWQKWGAQLKAAGLRPGQSFKVRYYLYDFVRRSIYARVNQAYQWSRAKGLIKAGTKPDEVDVLGRTFVINRSGGGAFGVFVPLLLKTGDGRRVKIDPLCFGDAPDIKALRRAGLI